jgi:hypothetical protein
LKTKTPVQTEVTSAESVFFAHFFRQECLRIDIVRGSVSPASETPPLMLLKNRKELS